MMIKDHSRLLGHNTRFSFCGPLRQEIGQVEVSNNLYGLSNSATAIQELSMLWILYFT